jgi:hypothetical protein
VKVTSDARSVMSNDGAFAVAVDDSRRMSVEVEEGTATVSGIPGADVVRAGERLLTLSDGRATVTQVGTEPLLEVAWPGRTRQARVPLRGSVEPGAFVRWVDPAAGEAVRADDQGRFEVMVVLREGPQRVELEVVDAFGNKRTVSGSIERDTKGPRFTVEPARSP